MLLTAYSMALARPTSCDCNATTRAVQRCTCLGVARVCNVVCHRKATLLTRTSALKSSWMPWILARCRYRSAPLPVAMAKVRSDPRPSFSMNRRMPLLQPESPRPQLETTSLAKRAPLSQVA